MLGKRGEFDLLWPQKYVDVIVQESPGKAVCTGFSKKSGKVKLSYSLLQSR
jgi:hypothetical protein